MIANISTALKSHFLRLYQIACSDENFDVLEMKQLYKFAEQRGIDVQQLQNILIDPVFRLNIPEKLNERIEYLYDLAVMIWIDGVVTEDEYNTLRKFCKNFEFMDENINQICDYLLDCAKKELSIHSVLENINN
ncbi:hypothetical protein KSK37_00570 [Kaistella sp. DKR-2]|uniref:TerB family tellurite resistance protein n=1 Tax=Kaistella soli TaxID=2849654 RepID=UPI001C275F9D|nr:TerB family tellurite resistance protein [Kaistella soli]MBU8881569.1 hypothetical protein [Kaistella soli]